MSRVIPSEVLDIAGNLKRIEFHNEKGEFVVQALWDDRDEQTSKNRAEFRKWAYRQLEQQGHEVIK